MRFLIVDGSSAMRCIITNTLEQAPTPGWAEAVTARGIGSLQFRVRVRGVIITDWTVLVLDPPRPKQDRACAPDVRAINAVYRNRP